MKILVTGSSGHLGEALVRTLQGMAHEVVGLDRKSSPFTGSMGSITDRDFVRACVRGVDAVIHAATLHKPHAVTRHSTGLCGYQPYRYAQPSGGSGVGRRLILCLYEYDEHVRTGADAAAGCPCGMGDRGRAARS
jgi:hypothetical protein